MKQGRSTWSRAKARGWSTRSTTQSSCLRAPTAFAVSASLTGSTFAMSMTDSFDGNRYEIVAWARNQKPVYYHEFGGYTGEWLLVATNEAETYHLYKGWYGSCSGCDAYEDMFDSSPTK